VGRADVYSLWVTMGSMKSWRGNWIVSSRMFDVSMTIVGLTVSTLYIFQLFKQHKSYENMRHDSKYILHTHTQLAYQISLYSIIDEYEVVFGLVACYGSSVF